MADEPNQNQNQNNAGGDDGKGKGAGSDINNPNGQGSNDGNSDKGKNGGDQQIPKYRFDEVNSKLEKLEAEKAERERKDQENTEAKLKDEKKFEELSTKHEQDAQSERAKNIDLRKQLVVERAAIKAGVVDTDAAYKLIDQSKIKVDKDGNVDSASVEEAIKALITDKPYLAQKGNASTIGAGTGGNQAGDAKKYAMTWVREHWGNIPWQKEKHPDMGFGELTGDEILRKIEAEKLIDYNA